MNTNITETQRAVLEWMANGETGMSSETMAYWLAFGVRKDEPYAPHDSWDFRRCLQLLHAAPALRESLPKMAELSPCWRAIADSWTQIEQSYLAEVGNDPASRLHARETGRMIHGLLMAAGGHNRSAHSVHA